MSQGTLKNLIGGEWVASNATQTLPVLNPTAGETRSDCPMGTGAEVLAPSARRRARTCAVSLQAAAGRGTDSIWFYTDAKVVISRWS